MDSTRCGIAAFKRLPQMRSEAPQITITTSQTASLRMRRHLTAPVPPLPSADWANSLMLSRADKNCTTWVSTCR